MWLPFGQAIEKQWNGILSPKRTWLNENAEFEFVLNILVAFAVFHSHFGMFAIVIDFYCKRHSFRCAIRRVFQMYIIVIFIFIVHMYVRHSP